MADHYFTNSPQSTHAIREFTENLQGMEFNFRTDAGVFSKEGVDKGTQLLISTLQCAPGDMVADIGCGYGPIGLCAAKMIGPTGIAYLVDVNERAVELAKSNADVNGIANVDIRLGDTFSVLAGLQFDWILTNPPIRAGKQVIYPLVENAIAFLKPGGQLVLVIRTKQGAKSMLKLMDGVFGNVETVKLGSGFRVLASKKIN